MVILAENHGRRDGTRLVMERYDLLMAQVNLD
jgi:hypothetical protein